MISAATVAAVKAQTDLVELCREQNIELRPVRVGVDPRLKAAITAAITTDATLEQACAENGVQPGPSQHRTDLGKHKGSCPFCDVLGEKSDFWVDPVRGFFSCFACKESGTAVDLWMKLNQRDFGTAVTHLAACAGIEVVREDPPQDEDVAWMLSLENAKFWSLLDDVREATTEGPLRMFATYAIARLGEVDPAKDPSTKEARAYFELALDAAAKQLGITKETLPMALAELTADDRKARLYQLAADRLWAALQEAQSEVARRAIDGAAS